MAVPAEVVAALVGSRPVEWSPVASGYTLAAKWRVRFDDGARAFVKAGAAARELLVYREVEGPFLPRCLGIAGDVLVLEDLGEARWPPPYPDDAAPLLDALERVAATPAPASLPRLVDAYRMGSAWQRLRDDPAPLLALGVASAEWLDAAVDALAEAEARADRDGGALVHNDVYAGNVCFAGGRAVLVDWSEAAVGSPWLDRAFAAVSLRVEGARVPPLGFPDEGAFAALLAGHVALEAVSPPPPAWGDAGVALRADQAADLPHALAWAAEALGLPPVTSGR